MAKTARLGRQRFQTVGMVRMEVLLKIWMGETEGTVSMPCRAASPRKPERRAETPPMANLFSRETLVREVTEAPAGSKRTTWGLGERLAMVVVPATALPGVGEMEATVRTDNPPDRQAPRAMRVPPRQERLEPPGLLERLLDPRAPPEGLALSKTVWLASTASTAERALASVPS
jgi:hypothetical protein